MNQLLVHSQELTSHPAKYQPITIHNTPSHPPLKKTHMFANMQMGDGRSFMEFLRRASPLQLEVLRRLPRQSRRGTSCWWGHHHRSNDNILFISIYKSLTTLLRLMITIVWHRTYHLVRGISTTYTTITYKMFVCKPTPTAWEASATGSAGSCWPSWTCRDKHILGRAEAVDHDDHH